MLKFDFFNRDAQCVAKELLGKVIYHQCHNIWLSAMIIETEAYYLIDKASHASLGFTEKRKALFMPAGTIYMYYARGGDSLNISCQGEGNAVLIKSGIIYPDQNPNLEALKIMLAQNPLRDGGTRTIERLCSGQTVFCRSLGLKVTEWNQQNFDERKFYITDVNYTPEKIIQTTRLGIPKGRDEYLPYRFIDAQYLKRCSLGGKKYA
jgi:DNA-3-methyladenine glycosylase